MCNAAEWKLLLDSSVISMKVLLHIGNEVASVLIAHSVQVAECNLHIKHALEL